MTVLAVLFAVACLLAFAVYRLKRAARWIDATLQDPQPATTPTPTTTAPKKETTTR